MVIPRESEWFGAFQDGGEAFVVPMSQQPIYTEDWIGLKELNATGRLIQTVRILVFGGTQKDFLSYPLA